MKKILSFLILLSVNLAANSQETTSDANLAPTLSKAFENPDPELELQRLQGKRDQLVIRLNELKTSTQPDSIEIARVEGLIKYIDVKIESIQKYLNSEEHAQKQGMPEQGQLSDEEYQAKLNEWKKQQTESEKTGNEGIKTTLTREEFNKLPKERQDRILAMPERYTIVD